MIPLALALAFALPALSTRPGQAAPTRARAAAEAGESGDSTPAGKTRRIVVLRFFGRAAEVARAATMDALAEDVTIELVSMRLLEAQKDLTGSVQDRTIELGRRLNLTALVRGRVKKARGNVHTILTVVGGADGEVLGVVNIQARTMLALHAKLRSQAAAKLLALIDRAVAPPAVAERERPPRAAEEAPPAVEKPPAAQAEPPPPAEETPAPREKPTPEERPRPRPEAPHAEAKPDSEAESESPPAQPASRRCDMIELESSGGVMLRRFDYRDEQRGALRGYLLNRALAGRLEGSFYPIVGGRCGHGVSFGFRGAFEQMAPVVSRLPDRALHTTAYAYQAEAVLRIALGALTLKPSGGYFFRSYVIAEDVVPYVDYHAVGGALDAELRLGLFLLELGGGARYLLSGAELQTPDFFPHTTNLAYLARARLGVAVTDWLDFLVGASAEYYTFTFHVSASDPSPNGVAAGAFDAYLLATATFRLHFPGNGRIR